MTEKEVLKISEEILVALDVIEEQHPQHLPWALMTLSQLSQPVLANDPALTELGRSLNKALVD